MLQTDTKSEPISYEGLPLSKYIKIRMNLLEVNI